MKKYTYNFIWTFGFLMSLAWTLYTIFSNWGTSCFSFFKTYTTIIILILNLVWSNFVKSEKGDLNG